MLATLEAPELVFGICSPIGTNNEKVRELIRTSLLRFGYKAVEFKVTELMKSVLIRGMSLKSAPIDERYDSYIKYANKLRELFKDPSILSTLCSMAARHYRRQHSASEYVQHTAYIFDQFKRKEEIEALRQTYGRLFVLISVYSDRDIRIRDLSERIASDRAVARPTPKIEESARQLVDRDENEEGETHGQRLRDTFALADLFINIDNQTQAREHVERFLHALFGSNLVSPTKDEYAMYLAMSASLRSLDLSRQVGAAIFTSTGEVVALGANEVPKAGGGTYWCDDGIDARDYRFGHDENERIKRSILADVVRRLKEEKILKTRKKKEELVDLVLAESARRGSSIRDAQLMDLLEFGRIIHAEMSAISDAARLGRSILGTNLYCTTFPCHICAKHIVAAGISRVTYIEPYPKSYASQLHHDSIIVKADVSVEKKVNFSPFIGISPFRFREIFQRTRRKDDHGKLSEWAEGKPKPIVKYTVATYLENEKAYGSLFTERAKRLSQQGAISIKGRKTSKNELLAAPSSMSIIYLNQIHLSALLSKR
jgi:deoxycytidylate deaminase